jgi:predicted nucleotidyltransferase component of viral defense system
VPARLLSDLEVREAFHVVLLRHLADTQKRGTWRLKGGVNLRLFFDSVRYSEDIDLDADLRIRNVIKAEIRRAIRSPKLLTRLAQLGIREIRQSQREIAKDTETTLRVKMHLVVGAVPLPTKIEVSFRPGCPEDEVREEAAAPAIVGKYLTSQELPLILPHYALLPAVRQKLAALALRNQVQARDVFDLFALTKGETAALDLQLLRRNLNAQTLCKARDRALELPQSAYRDTVLGFLDEQDQARFAGIWEEQQLFAAHLADSILAASGEPSADVCGRRAARIDTDSQPDVGTA